MEKLDETRGPWHPGTKAQKPVRRGWYEVKGVGNDQIYKRYWDGEQWCWSGSMKYRAIIQSREWRGLAKKPE